MADVLPQTQPYLQARPSQPITIDRPSTPVQHPALPNKSLRGAQLALDTFSPISQNGCFEFDRVIKSGTLLKRTKKTKSWKSVHLVLRPNLLSIYRNAEESRLRHQINLSDLTAVARQKDPKGRAKHVFGLFSPSRNYHLAAPNDAEAQEWVEAIRREARIDEEEGDMVLASPGGAKSAFNGFGRHMDGSGHGRLGDHAEYSSSEADIVPSMHSTKTRPCPPSAAGLRRPSHTLDYSGPEHASYSDFSDSGVNGRMSTLSLNMIDTHTGTGAASVSQHSVYGAPARLPSNSQMSGLDVPEARSPAVSNDERVICHGWMYLLKSKSGVRQWKKVWMVLRPKTLALYKNEEEYSAQLIVPFHNVIDCVEIDPISRSKKFCLQILTEERNHRCCAPDEDSLAKWLGAFKSLLVRRREMALQRAAVH